MSIWPVIILQYIYNNNIYLYYTYIRSTTSALKALLLQHAELAGNRLINIRSNYNIIYNILINDIHGT